MGYSVKPAKATDWYFSGKKIFAQTERLMAFLHKKKFSPVSLQLDTTTDCPHACPNCTYPARAKDYLSFRAVQSLFRQMDALKIKGLTLTGGGENLTNPDIVLILSDLPNHPFSSGMISNAHFPNDDGELTKIQESLLFGLSWFRTSLDAGSESCYRGTHGIKGEFGRTIANLERLNERRKETKGKRLAVIGASFLTAPHTRRDIVIAAEVAASIGLDYIQFKPMLYPKRRFGHSVAAQFFPQDGVNEAIDAAKRQFESNTFSVLSSDQRYEFQTKPPKYSAFHSAWFIAVVTPKNVEGRVFPWLSIDCDMKYTAKGEIGKASDLELALNSPRREELIRRFNSSEYATLSNGSLYSHTLEVLMENYKGGAITEADIHNIGQQEYYFPDTL